MRYPLIERITRPRTVLAIVATIAVSLAPPAGVAQASLPPQGPDISSLISDTTDAKVTGGGTVRVDIDTIASFGLNAKRPAAFNPGEATGRINYDKHSPGGDRHVNVPVSLMEAATNNTPPNGTGGKAWIAGDCIGPLGAQCPTGIGSALVYVEDNGDSGGNVDKFEIFYCFGEPNLPPANQDPTMPPTGCAGPEGGPLLRTGNVQIRPGGGSGGAGQAPTAARAPIRLP
jgi:hypothetical protein